MFRLMKDLAGLLNYFDLSTFITKFLHKLTCSIKKSKKRTNKHQKQRSKMLITVLLCILILQRNIQKELKKTDKKIAEKRDDDGIEFPVQEKDFNNIEVKNNICINVFGYENELVFPIYVSDQRF